MKTIITEIIINASKEQVWNVLTNFSDYPNWNPFIISIEGSAELNTKLTNTMSIQGKTQTFKPKVETLVENQKFEWIGKLPLGLFTGHHCFEIVELDSNQVKLIHKEVFSGWLSGMILKQIKEDTRAGFVAMNKALKIEAEK